MYSVAKWGINDRKVLFENTANKMGVDVNIIEKDYYVCFLIGYLFEKSKFKDYFTFKGGTSLSKAYNIIKRFSEDIDIILDFEAINMNRDIVYEKKSNTQQDKIMAEIEKQNSDFLKNTLIPLMIKDLINDGKYKFNIYFDNTDNSIKVNYDNIYKDEYNKPELKLEISPRADKVPNHNIKIEPYIALEYGDRIEKKEVMVATVDAERSFWEKITILHKLANWNIDKPLPRRYSRHYYDIYCMSKNEIKEKAFKKKDLLDKDIKFKELMYRSNTSGYDTAKIGMLKLVPKEEHIKELYKDYKLMQDMIYGEKYSWEEIMKEIKELEVEINNL
jgi:hypothetical protein